MAESQAKALGRYLEAYGDITDLQALNRLGVRRLAARIYDLRRVGWRIDTVREKHKGGSHARYILRALPPGG